MPCIKPLKLIKLCQWQPSGLRLQTAILWHPVAGVRFIKYAASAVAAINVMRAVPPQSGGSMRRRLMLQMKSFVAAALFAHSPLQAVILRHLNLKCNPQAVACGWDSKWPDNSYAAYATNNVAIACTSVIKCKKWEKKRENQPRKWKMQSRYKATVQSAAVERQVNERVKARSIASD